MFGIIHLLSIFHLVMGVAVFCMFLLLEGRGKSLRKSMMFDSFESDRLSLAHLTKTSNFQAGISCVWRTDVERVSLTLVVGTMWYSELGSSLMELQSILLGTWTTCTPDTVNTNSSRMESH